jgi:hypothetical protein
MIQNGRLMLVVHLVDGGIMDIPEDNAEQFLKKLKQLRDMGYEGKQLVNELITDDWGPPPVAVVVKGKLLNGKTVNFTLSYD